MYNLGDVYSRKIFGQSSMHTVHISSDLSKKNIQSFLPGFSNLWITVKDVSR